MSIWRVSGFIRVFRGHGDVDSRSAWRASRGYYDLGVRLTRRAL